MNRNRLTREAMPVADHDVLPPADIDAHDPDCLVVRAKGWEAATGIDVRDTDSGAVRRVRFAEVALIELVNDERTRTLDPQIRSLRASHTQSDDPVPLSVHDRSDEVAREFG
jgi:hypothetical protein